MNTRTEILLGKYSPQLAMIVYKNNDKSEYYLESHKINDKGQLLEGKPLLQDTVQGMIDIFFDERQNQVQINGVIPENLLSFELKHSGNYTMIWYQPAEVRVLHFAPELKLKTGEMWVPAMVYVANKNGLDVYAIKSNSRPSEKTILFRAPYFNVSDSGSVCLGNANVKKPAKTTYAALQKYWEDLFWLSEFTHVNGNNPTKSKIAEVYKKLLASKKQLKWSDLNELVPTKQTLKSIL